MQPLQLNKQEYQPATYATHPHSPDPCQYFPIWQTMMIVQWGSVVIIGGSYKGPCHRHYDPNQSQYALHLF